MAPKTAEQKEGGMKNGNQSAGKDGAWATMKETAAVAGSSVLKTASAGARYARTGAVAAGRELGKAGVVVKDKAIIVGTYAYEKGSQGARAVVVASKKGAVAVKDKWNDLTPEQRRNAKAAGGVALALLLLKKILTRPKPKEEAARPRLGRGIVEDGARDLQIETRSPGKSSMETFGTPMGSPSRGTSFIKGSPAPRSPLAISSPSRSRVFPGKRVKVLEPGMSVLCGQEEVSIMSYGLVTDTAAKGVGYRHIKSDWLRWEHRFPAMLEQIKEHGADIVCLQGIDPTNKAFTWVRAMRQLGYEACLQDRQKAGGFYAVATFWKADKFHPEPVWEEHRLRALVVELVPLRKGGKRLVVANMALESHANRPHDRVLQTRGLLSAIARRVEQQGGRRPDYQGTPLLLCGSMGGDATSGAYTLVTKGVLEEGATEMSSPGVVLTERELSHPFKLQDAYSTAGSEVSFTRKLQGSRDGAVDDFIFFGSAVDLLAVTQPMTAAQAAAVREMPSKDHPSDHLPIAAVFKA